VVLDMECTGQYSKVNGGSDIGGLPVFLALRRSEFAEKLIGNAHGLSRGSPGRTGL
jgi:hypothetical protein